MVDPVQERSILHRDFLAAKVELLQPRVAATIPPHAKIADAILIMRDRSIGSILLSDKDEIKGIFTERDAFKRAALKGIDPLSCPIEKVATAKVETIKGSASIARLLHLMANDRIRHVPVTGGKALRIISVRDVLKFLHDRITGKIVKLEQVILSPNFQVDRFFESTLNILKADPPVTLLESATIKTALESMSTRKVGSIVIADAADKVIGIFTERDYLNKVALGSHAPESLRVGDVMSRNPQTAQGSMTTAFAMNLMFAGGYRHIPIVDRDERLKGVLSARSFLNFLAQAAVDDLDAHKTSKPKS